MTQAPYQPFYCEENAWQLAQRIERGWVWLITNRARTVAMLHQRAGDPVVVWDYHVVVVDDDRVVHDPDTTLAPGVRAAAYLDACFPVGVFAPAYAPAFRVFDIATYRAQFCSDRSHMLDDEGAYRAPPPPWLPIRPERGNCLSRWLDLDEPTPGAWSTRAHLHSQMAEPA